MPEIEDPWNSRPIDVHRWSDHPEVRELTDRLWERFMPEKGPSGPKPKTPPRNMLRVLLIDLYVAWLEDPRLCIGVSMSTNAWDTNSRYNALHLSKQIIPIIKTLHAAEMLDLAKGSYSGPYARTNRTTRIRASAQLQAMFREISVARDDIHQAENQEIIILKGRPDELLEYDDDNNTKSMRADLSAYNEVIAQSFIDIPILEEPKIDDVVTDHHHKLTRRIFSRRSWKRNGRFYGGWWQRIGSDWRSKIFINDTPTVEVDYQSQHITMLSLEAGVVPEGDPYQLPDDLFPEFTPEQLRSIIKNLILRAVNADARDAAYSAFREDFPTGDPAKRLKNDQLDRLLAAFLERNSHLEQYLFSDQGIRLMYQDGLITERVHRHFTEQNVPVLSVHDSFIIDYTRVAELKRVMAEASEAVLGRALETSNEHYGLDEEHMRPEYVTLDHVRWRQTERCSGYLDRLRAHEERTDVEIVPYWDPDLLLSWHPEY